MLRSAIIRRAFSSSPAQAHARPISARTATRLLLSLGLGVGAVGFAANVWRSDPLRLDVPAPPLPAGHAPPAKVPVPDSGRLIGMEEVRTHRSKEDCWVVLNDEIWDVTEFLALHPGGAAVILKHAGTDVSSLFKAVHPPRTFEKHQHLVGKRMGRVDKATVAKTEGDEEKEKEQALIATNRTLLPPVEQVRGLREMEELAKTVLSRRAKIYYSGGSDDEQSLRDSFASYQRCRFRPRVLVDVAEVDPRTSILNFPSSMLPIYIAPAAYARLGHELGEINLTRGAARTGIVQGISANASQSLEDLLLEKRALEDAGEAEVGLVYQVYVNRDRRTTEQLMREAVRGGCKAFFLTVDSPTLGNRESDFRAQGLVGDMDNSPHNNVNTSTFSYYDTSLSWRDLPWLKESACGLPLYIKGVATVEDVELARKHGAAGVVLSNHGGRQLDGARSPMDTLLEIVERNPSLTRDLEIYVDGGVRRGTDVLKALCLGAKGVGLGRSFLYAQTAYGEQGVIRAVRILENEIVTGMRLLGARTIADLKPEMIECLERTHRIPGARSGTQ